MADDISNLGIGVDSSQVNQGTESLNNFAAAGGRAGAAAAGFSAATATAGAAAARIAASVGVGISGASAALNKAVQMNNAFGAKFNSSVQGMVNSAGAAAQKTGAAFQQVGQQLNTAGGAINRFFTTMRSGGQTLMSATANLLSFGQAANSAANNVTRLNVAANQNMHTVQAGRYHTANFAAQLQDIGVQAATATSPLQVALQQGTQISMIFAGMGAAGALRTFAGAIASVFSPLTLMIILLTGVATAGLQAVSWIPLMQNGLRALADLLPRIATGVAIVGATLLIAFAPRIIVSVMSLIAAIARLTVSVLGLAAAFVVANPFAAFVIGVGLAITAAVYFREQLEQTFGFDVVKVIQDWGNWTISIAVTTFQAFADVWNHLPDVMSDIFTHATTSMHSILRDELNADIQTLNDFADLANSIWTFGGRVGGPNAGISHIDPITSPSQRENRAKKDSIDSIFDNIDTNWKNNKNRDWLTDIGQGIGGMAEWAQKKLKELADTLGMDNISKAIKKAHDYILTQKSDIEQLQIEIALVGEGSVAREKYMAILKAEQEIRKLGIPLYGKEALEIRKNAEEIAKLTEVLAKAKFQDDQNFRRRQVGRSPEDAQIAQELRAAGFTDNLKSAEADVIRQTIAVERLKETWQSVFDVVDKGIDSFVDALFDGTKDFGDVLRKLGRDIARLFFDLAVTNPIKNWLTGANLNSIKDLGIFKSGATSGRGGGFGGVLGNLFGAKDALSAMSVTAGTVIVNGAISSIPGLKDVLGDTLGDTTGGAAGKSVLGSIVPGTGSWTGASKGTSDSIMNFFTSKGLQPHQAAGIIGNLSAESGLNPGAVNPKSGALGLAQWLGSRKDDLVSQFGSKPSQMQQLEFMWSELHNKESATLEKLLKSTNVRESTRAFAGFERAEGYKSENPEGIALWNRRLSSANSSLSGSAGNNRVAGSGGMDLFNQGSTWRQNSGGQILNTRTATQISKVAGMRQSTNVDDWRGWTYPDQRGFSDWSALTNVQKNMKQQVGMLNNEAAKWSKLKYDFKDLTGTQNIQHLPDTDKMISEMPGSAVRFKAEQLTKEAKFGDFLNKYQGMDSRGKAVVTDDDLFGKSFDKSLLKSKELAEPSSSSGVSDLFSGASSKAAGIDQATINNRIGMAHNAAAIQPGSGVQDVVGKKVDEAFAPTQSTIQKRLDEHFGPTQDTIGKEVKTAFGDQGNVQKRIDGAFGETKQEGIQKRIATGFEGTETKVKTAHATEALDNLTSSSKMASDSLNKAGLAGFETVSGLTNAAGGLTKFGSLLSSFMAPGGGSGTGWFQGLASMFGGAGGAISSMMNISPGATGAILAGGALGPMGLYHSGGTAGSATQWRTVHPSVFSGAPRYHKGGIAGLEPGEIPAVLKRGEPVFQSWDHARKTFAGNDNAMDWDSIGKALARHTNRSFKNINIVGNEVFNDYLRSEGGQEVLVNEIRRNSGGGRR